MMRLPEGSNGFTTSLVTDTHYRLVNVLSGIVTGVLCMKCSEQFGTFVVKGLILLGLTHPVS